jgi:glutaredoxin 3
MVNNSGIEVDIEAATAEADESSDDPVTLSNFISGQFPTVRNSPVETPLKKEDLASTVPPPEQAPAVNNVIVVTDLSSYSGATLEEQVDDFLTSHSVIVVATSTCPFCRDVKDLLANEIGVETYILNVDSVPDGSKILAYIKKTTGQKTVPVCFIRGTFIGGCDTLKALHAQGDLEGKLLYGLVNRQRTAGTERLATSHLIAPERSQACHPLFWFPNVVNNYVIRVVGFQVCALSVVSAVFLDDLFAHWIAAGLLVDFCLRTLAGASASPLGMIATLITSPVRPLFKPGPPKQFASVCGIMFSGLGTIFYFVEFEGHQYFGMAFMAMLAGASGLEWALDFCLGCKFYSIGIWMGLIPDYVYRIYTSSKQETEDSWDYVFQDSHAPGPEKVDTDPTTPISLKYKHKTDEWSKDDFDGVRHMQVTYFAMPLGITGLAVAFKIASTWSLQFYQAVTGNDMEQRSVVVHDEWFQVIASIGAFVFLIMLFLYAIRMVFYTHKCMTEWDCPLRSPSFGAISITMMLFSFLLYDEIDYDPRDEEPSQIAARVIFWVGAVAHVLLTVSKMGEWIARRMELEHVHAQWMILPVGLSVAALVAPIVPLFAEETSNAVGTIFIARFFYSFAVLMWITLFVITFFKVVTTHNSDTRIRYGIFIWLAAPCVLGLADFSICVSDGMGQQCVGQFANYYFIGIFMFLCILWSVSHIHVGVFAHAIQILSKLFIFVNSRCLTLPLLDLTSGIWPTGLHALPWMPWPLVLLSSTP